MMVGYILTGGGYGLYQAMQGLLASYGDKTHTGQVYATAALIDLVARMTGAIAYSNLFQWGWQLLPRWGVGLPFFIVSVSIPPFAMVHMCADKQLAAQFLDAIRSISVAHTRTNSGVDGMTTAPLGQFIHMNEIQNHDLVVSG